MHVDIERFGTGWLGLGVGLSPSEIDALVDRLIAIRDDPSKHFHFRSEFEGDPGVGDIEFYVKDSATSDNMVLE
jgi:hypothetical protein